MPIIIPNKLPARKTLEKEGIFVMDESRASTQDIRPLRIALLNLMPLKITTETQFARLLGSTPLQVELSLLKVLSHTSKNTPIEHMEAFYTPWEKARDQKFDGLIITGAPVEDMEFEEVKYWEELKEIFEWSRKNVFSTFNVCWGAQAALNHFYGIKKYRLKEKMFGLFPHFTLRKNASLTKGLDDVFMIPVSRHTEIKRKSIEENENLEILIESKESGVCLLQDKKYRHIYMFNHLEYDRDRLKIEYLRDLESRGDVPVPKNYFPDNNPNNEPLNSWRSCANVLYDNWIGYIYQGTPYNLSDLDKDFTWCVL
ncbi:homoserine O-succinyltransferase [Desulfococcaceae bacterium HSG8]|nr:homoserine O-succinyltransferase [Desulfococcaceae bacterium HSG8]